MFTFLNNPFFNDWKLFIDNGKNTVLSLLYYYSVVTIQSKKLKNYIGLRISVGYCFGNCCKLFQTAANCCELLRTALTDHPHVVLVSLRLRTIMEMMTMIMPITPSTVGISRYTSGPTSRAAVGSAPEARIDATPEST